MFSRSGKGFTPRSVAILRSPVFPSGGRGNLWEFPTEPIMLQGILQEEKASKILDWGGKSYLLKGSNN